MATDGKFYLLYTGRGENVIGIAQVDVVVERDFADFVRMAKNWATGTN